MFSLPRLAVVSGRRRVWERAFARGGADWMGGAGMMQMLAPAAWAVRACGAA